MARDMGALCDRRSSGMDGVDLAGTANGFSVVKGLFLELRELRKLPPSEL